MMETEHGTVALPDVHALSFLQALPRKELCDHTDLHSGTRTRVSQPEAAAFQDEDSPDLWIMMHRMEEIEVCGQRWGRAREGGGQIMAPQPVPSHLRTHLSCVLVPNSIFWRRGFL